MNEHEISTLRWFKSSRSSGNGQCTEAARLPDGGMAVRDSKNPTGSVLYFTADEWAAFVDGVKLGEFD